MRPPCFSYVGAVLWTGGASVTRVCVFIDGSNFYHSCRVNLGRTDVKLVPLLNSSSRQPATSYGRTTTVPLSILTARTRRNELSRNSSARFTGRRIWRSG